MLKFPADTHCLQDDCRVLRDLFPAEVDRRYGTRRELRVSGSNYRSGLCSWRGQHPNLGERVASQVPSSGGRTTLIVYL